MVNKWIDFLQFKLFPPTCILCGAPGLSDLDICRECLDGLALNSSCCSRCAIPLPNSQAGSGDVCGSCLKSAPKFDSCFSPFIYEGAVADLISGLKFSAQLQSGRLLASLMRREIEGSRIKLPDIIIPIPLHSRRLRERGYNQSLELGRHLARRLQLPLDRRSCVRTRITEAQSSLPKNKRIKNVRGAFALRRKIHAGHVVLLDDVVTTGSTVNELAGVLKKSGVEQVSVWSIARTP